MDAIKNFLIKYQAFFQGLMAPLGIWGAFVISAVDAAAFGIPMDIVIAHYAVSYHEQLGMVFVVCLLASAGSAFGSLAPYWLGRRGGEPFLLKRITHERLEELRDRYESWEFLSVMVPSMLPPPTPMKLIVLAAGAFEMRVPVFLMALFAGRMLRFGLVSSVIVAHGWERWAFVALAGAVGLATWFWYRRATHHGKPDPSQPQPEK